LYITSLRIKQRERESEREREGERKREREREGRMRIGKSRKERMLVCIPLSFIKAETFGVELTILKTSNMPFWYVS
jgi:hypothetical protein